MTVPESKMKEDTWSRVLRRAFFIFFVAFFFTFFVVFLYVFYFFWIFYFIFFLSFVAAPGKHTGQHVFVFFCL